MHLPASATDERQPRSAGGRGIEIIMNRAPKNRVRPLVGEFS